MNKFKNGNTKSVVLAVVLTTVVVGSVGALYFYYLNLKQVEEDAFFKSEEVFNTQQNIKDFNERKTVPDDDNANIIKEIKDDVAQSQKNTIESTISKGEIQWQKPQNVGDLGYFKNGDGECKTQEKSIYYKTGKVISGSYAGFDIYNVKGDAGCSGPFMDDYGFRILVKGNKVIFLKGTERFEDWEMDLLRTYIGGESETRVINGNISIEDLSYPDKLDVDGYVLQNKKYFISTLFVDNTYDILQKVGTSSYGDIWTTNRKKADAIYTNKEDKTPEEIQTYQMFDTNAFYVKAPDGSMIQYVLQLPFLPKEQKDVRNFVLPITWNDNTLNQEEYELYPMGCGVVRYAYDVTGQVDVSSDLVQIGMLSTGDKIYGYKDVNNSEFKKWYKNTYWAEGGNKKSEIDVLKEHPQIFWIDLFGRTLTFYNTSFISPAECGKPVIYLYPEKDMDVHVQVTPKQGFTITEPDYGKDGWFVHATTDSVITNYANNKKYPYLFWEGNSDELLPNMEEGFVVNKDELSQFFDDTLTRVGLNEKEIADFKEFWIPKMKLENKPYYQVSFLSKVFINKSAPLTIEPKPDTVIRVLMNYEGLDKYRKIQSQYLHAPERTGFTVVEWGGILH